MVQVVVLEPFETGSGTAVVGSTVDVDESLARLMVTARKARFVVPPPLAGDLPELTAAQVQSLRGWVLAADGPGFMFFAGRAIYLNGDPIAII